MDFNLEVLFCGDVLHKRISPTLIFKRSEVNNALNARQQHNITQPDTMAATQKLYPRGTVKRIVKAHSNKSVSKNADILVRLTLIQHTRPELQY